MPLASGARLGPYEIQSAIGVGGMGEVYRARDVKLGRDVALKLLPDILATDPDRLARFQREAQVLASLNHPHIAQIYGLEESSGARAFVMELVEGVTLADRIAQGPLPITEAVTVAHQVAEALDAAHEKGIIHRDLKPANVMVTHGGMVKVLDFGLAAVAQGSGPQNVDIANSPTLSIGATRAGVILGTAGYMSPEQAAGKTVDKRADIWSFGVMLWELLIGKRLFEGETVSHTLADVLRAPIDFDQLPKGTPPAIRELLRRCLDRDAKNRLRDIGEVRVALEKYLAHSASGEVAGVVPFPTSEKRSPLTIAAWSLAAAALAVAATLAFVRLRERPPVAEPVSFQLLPPDGTTFLSTVVLSPDGRRLAFDGPGSDGRPVLWVRSLDSLDVRPLPGTEGAASGPIWSPDGRFLAFGVNGFPGRLKKVDASGGPPQTLAEYSGGFRGGAWNQEGTILFGAENVQAGGLLKVADGGGTPVQVTSVDRSRQEVLHALPTFLPDGRQFLYQRLSRLAENAGIYRGALDETPEGQSLDRLLHADSGPLYVPPPNPSDEGHLLFLRGGALMVQPVGSQSELVGESVPIAGDVGSLGSYGWFSASTKGALAFRTGRAATATTELLWFDRQGKRIGQLGSRAEWSFIQLSPDGRKVFVTRNVGVTLGLTTGQVQGVHTWTAELSRGIFSRLNPGEGGESSPAVSPDGRVAFSSTLNGAVGDLYWMHSGGVGTPEPLVVKSPTVKHPNHISLDGRFLIYDDHTSQRQDLWILPLESSPGSERKPIPFLATPADETLGQFSPDGKWIAYSSDESGRREVYVQGFAADRVPAAAVGKWQISTAGGDKPRWRRDGKELYYIAPDRKLMAVPVKIGTSFEPGLAVPLFETRVVGFLPYDVSADGRFLRNTVSEFEGPTASPVTIVLNWQAGLKK